MGKIIDSPRDIWNSFNYGLPSAIYFYFLNENIPNFNSGDMDILGNCPSIQSIQLVPFITHDDLTLYKTPYDVERFGEIDKSRPGLTDTPNVYRISNDVYSVKKIGSFKCYKPIKSIGGEKSWKNESRLYNYPFAFAMINDHLNPPMEVKYNLCKNNNVDVKVKSTISDRCSYGIFIEGYKGDINGKLESMVSGDAHELPCSSSAYSQWFASNKNQTAQDVKNSIDNSFLTKETNAKMRLPNMIGSLTGMNSNPMSWIGAGANIYGQNVQYNQANKRADLDIQQSIQSKIAQANDLKSTPNTMLSMGSDVYFGLVNGSKKVNLYRFGLQEEYYNKIGDYFAMFGYKQNKILTPNIRNRYYYNYIKTVGCNIKGENIPREHLDELKGIFDNGVTIWHYDRERVTVGDYSMDNYEV